MDHTNELRKLLGVPCGQEARDRPDLVCVLDTGHSGNHEARANGRRVTYAVVD